MEELKRKTDQLSERVERLHDTIGQNTLALAQAHKRQDRSERKSRLQAMVLVALLGGFLILGWIAWQLHQATEAQAQLRAEVLCPLYGIFIGAYDPESRNDNSDPRAREKYEDAYNKIRRGWTIMECTDPIVPPRSEP